MVRLLRLPRAERLLPTSSALATGPDVRNIIPDPTPDKLDVLTMVSNDIGIRQTREPDHISLRSLGDELDEWVEDLDVAPTIVYTEVVSFRWTAIGSALFSARRWSSSPRKKVQVNEPLSLAWFPGWLRSFLPRRNRHATPSETTTEDTSTSFDTIIVFDL
ncbi:hypothetical protein B0H13DRAFT_158402 [Mycena leptocephala]|nr:hypothetical protein B0H13DRAFT_158402 [Mycena leptocephala]